MTPAEARDAARHLAEQGRRVARCGDDLVCLDCRAGDGGPCGRPLILDDYNPVVWRQPALFEGTA